MDLVKVQFIKAYKSQSRASGKVEYQIGEVQEYCAVAAKALVEKGYAKYYERTFK